MEESINQSEVTNQKVAQNSKKPLFSNLSSKLALLLTFLTPVLVIPSGIFPFQFTKTSVALVITLGLLGVLLWRMVKTKELSLHYSLLLYSLFFLPIVYLISSIFSTQPLRSFFGYQLETDTFAFILFATVLVYVLVMSLNKKNQIFQTLMSLLVASWVVFAFQLVQVLFNAPLPVAVLGDPIVNLIGRWNDFGIFAGLIASLILFSLQSFPLSKRGKYILSGTFIVALFFMMLVNLSTAWILFGLASLVVLVLSLAKNQFVEKKQKITLTVILATLGVLASVFFVFFGGQTATQLQNTFNINALEVRPSVEGTIDVLSGVYSKNPVVGSGPNTFSSSWLLFRPDGVLQTPFWNTSFGTGSGVIPTAFVNGGIIVALAWLIFSLLLIYTIFRALFVSTNDGDKTYILTVFTAVGSLYLLAIHYVHAPSQSLTLLLFIFVGLFIASLRGTKLIKTIHLNGIMSPRVGFGMTLAGVALALVALGVVYDTGKTYVAVINHEQAVQLANTGNSDGAEKKINNAIRLEAQDRFYRTAALIQLQKLNRAIQGDSSDAEAQTVFQNALAGAIQFSGSAIQANPDRFENWFTRALVYSTVVPLGIDGAYENALATLEESRTRNPKSPEVELRFAEAHRAAGNIELARSAITASLEKKADYTPAILLRAQIALSQGELDEAIESVRNAVFFEPRNPTLLYQLGILFLQDENYTDAAAAFELALQNQPDYANAAFFLAQAYAFLGNLDDALSLMEQLSSRNPDNTLVVEARDALRSGENPFDQTGLESPVEDEIEVE